MPAMVKATREAGVGRGSRMAQQEQDGRQSDDE